MNTDYRIRQVTGMFYHNVGKIIPISCDLLDEDFPLYSITRAMTVETTDPVTTPQ